MSSCSNTSNGSSAPRPASRKPSESGDRQPERSPSILDLSNALEQQRQQIGLELHDGLGQLLTAVRITSQDIADAHLGEDDPLRGTCLRLVSAAEEALSLLRDITTELSPAALLRAETLRAALEVLVEKTCRTASLDCSLEWVGAIRFHDAERRTHAYRIVQEAVNNAVKHAGARSIRVSAVREGRAVVLTVSDDGGGFEMSADRQSLGIESIRRRSVALGASLSIRSAPGEGTIVTCTIPLTEASPFSPAPNASRRNRNGSTAAEP